MFDKPFRLHFSSVIENTLSLSWVILILVITNIMGMSQEIESIARNEAILAISVLLGIILLIFIINCIRWAKTYVILDEDTIIIEKRLLMSKKTTIGIKNISTVNLEQNLLQRVFRTYKIKLDTNSLTTANETDVKIVLKKDVAIKLQEKIVRMINNNDEVVLDEQEKYDIEYDFDKVVKHSILNIPIFAIIYAIIIVILLGAGFIIEGSGIGNTFQRLFTILFMVVPAAYAMIGGILKLYGFKVRRDKDKLNIRYGLITKKKYTIPIDKINAIVIRQPVLARIFRKYTVEIINVGMGEGQQESPVLFLMGSKKEISDKMKQILPEIEIGEETEPQPIKALVPISIKVIITTLIFLIPSLIFIPYLSVSIIGFAVLSGMLMYITRRIGVYDDYIKIVNGIFARKFTIIKYEKIQHITIRKSILTEKLNIEKADISILAEVTKVKHYTGYFEINKYEKIAENMIESGTI